MTPTPVPLEPGRWELVLTDILQPVVLTQPDDGSGRFFIAIRRGLIRVMENGVLLETPFLDLRDRSIQEFESIEQGLLGMAFHPNYAVNGFFYVYYVDTGQNIVVSRFQVSADDPNRADPDSEHRLLGIIKPAADHNGGNLVFGPDGYLYLGTGDGGIQRDPYGHAQSLDSLLGKILRLDVDHGEPYGIPPDNPFANAAGLDEIFGFGMRNPWRFSFDALTGDLYIADVGHKETEEVDFIPAGSPGGFNLGWNHYEGFDFYTLFEEPPVPPLPDHTPPIWTYSHGSGGRCAVVGGYVYRGSDLPALLGMYLFGDFCSGEIWGLRPGPDGNWAAETLFDTSFTISSFSVDARNEIYLLTLTNEIYKLVP
jgi:glucose/arabinose dehydrogenase